MGFFTKTSAEERVNKLLAEGRRDDALALCRRRCQEPVATAADWQLLGCLCADSGDVVTAKMALVKATRLDPGLGMSHVTLGKLLASTGEIATALDHLQQAVLLQPDDPGAWLALGIVSGIANQLPAAEKYCRRSLQLEPESSEARYNLANALQGQGRLAEAEPEYQRALNIDARAAPCWFMLAQTRLGLKKFAAAEVAATRALELAPQMGEIHYLLGSIAAVGGRNEQARGFFSKAAALLPTLPAAHLKLGEALFALADYQGATESFQRAVGLDSRNSGAYFALGQCFEERKLGTQALSCYRKAIEINPDHLKAHYGLAFLYARFDRHEEAAKHFAEVLRINPQDDQARHLLAAQQGKTTKTAPAAYVATLFDGFADSFDEKLVGKLGYRSPQVLCEMITEAVAPKTGSLDIIDLGCGTGLCAPLFRPIARTLYGIDLSPRMIDKARERGMYDALQVGDVVSVLRATSAAWDLAISADVFVYVGDLREVFAACSAALKPSGLFAFSVESADDGEAFVLRATGRYAHASDYIRRLADEFRFSILEHRAVILRKDKGEVDVDGNIFLLRSNSGPP